jgi:hypothetical protein
MGVLNHVPCATEVTINTVSLYVTWCGGRLEYLRRNPASSKEVTKRESSAWGYVLCHPVPGGYKYGDLALQVGGVSDETNMVMGCTPIQSVTDCTANYRPVLLSERAPYKKRKESNCKTKKIKIWSWATKGA